MGQEHFVTCTRNPAVNDTRNGYKPESDSVTGNPEIHVPAGILTTHSTNYYISAKQVENFRILYQSKQFGLLVNLIYVKE